MQSLLCAVLAALLLLATPCLGQQADAEAAFGPDSAAAQAQRRQRLDAVERVIEDPENSLREIEPLREELRTLRGQSAALGARLAGPRADARRALDALGPAPAADAAPEPPAVATRRTELTASASELETAARLADVNVATANRLLDRINEIRRDRFFERTLEPGPSVLEPQTWTRAGRGAAAAAVFAHDAVAAWIAQRRAAGVLGSSIAVLGVALTIAFVISFPLRLLARRRVGRLNAQGRLGADPRGVAAGLRAFIHLAAAVLSAYVLLAAAVSQGLSAEPLGAIGAGALASVLFVAIAHALARAWFAPADASVRLSSMSDARARAGSIQVLALAALAAVGWTVGRTGEGLGASRSSLDAAAAIEGLLGAAALFLLSREIGRDGEAAAAEGETRRGARGIWIRVGLMLAALVAAGAALGGYANLARFVVERAALAVIAGLGFAVLRAFARAVVIGVVAPRVRGAPSAGDETFSFWMTAALDAVLVVIAAPFAALIVGFERGDITDLAARALLGVRIGSFQISIVNFAVGAAVFAGALIATRLAQRGLAESVLPRTRIEPGARNSIVALVGYGGLILAFVFAVSAAGVDLTNIAIIAGALSVGVGFGLQGFVNNFVCGLTLLFERPIKIGDWIVLPSGQGYVKKIGMRATEIETFDRSTIIVPNAELVTSPVMNWTLRDRVGRVMVSVGVSYGSDPELVHRLLLETANAHPDTVTDPAPFVLWKDFGDSALIFEVRAYIRDIGRTFRVQNDLRFAIWRAFKEHGIEIPFPQRVVHMAGGGNPAKNEP